MAYYKMSCPLCKYNVPVINEFLYQSLEKICTQVPMDQLFVLAHQAYGEFVKSSKMHGKKVLDISIEQIRKHFECHTNSMLFTLLQELEEIKQMQEALKYKQPSATIINTRMKLSNQRMKLVKQLHLMAPSQKYNNNSVYIYEFT